MTVQSDMKLYIVVCLEGRQQLTDLYVFQNELEAYKWAHDMNKQLPHARHVVWERELT